MEGALLAHNCQRPTKLVMLLVASNAVAVVSVAEKAQGRTAPHSRRASWRRVAVQGRHDAQSRARWRLLPNRPLAAAPQVLFWVLLPETARKDAAEISAAFDAHWLWRRFAQKPAPRSARARRRSGGAGSGVD